ncbi:MAG: nucleoside kinase [Bacillota bacterium]|nr:nucleoside kinase [Bacillota bacterium]
MESYNLNLSNGEQISVEEGTEIYTIVKKYYDNTDFPVIMAKLNEDYLELTSKIEAGGNFSLVGISDKVGMKTYSRTLQFILIKAVRELFPEAEITIEHSINKGIYGEIHKGTDLTEDEIHKIKDKMIEIIKKDISIRKSSITREEALKIFKSYNMKDKERLIKYVNTDRLKMYELDGIYDYFYGAMAYSTGIIYLFDLIFYNPGFILRFPTDKYINELPPFIEYQKLFKIFRETERWGNILEVGDVGGLNDKVENGDIINLIRVAEALHEKKIAYIADMISERENVKIVLIAGPSSSGKTTFSKRLGIQLRVNGLVPIPISLDDYFVDRAHTPKDESGDYDFESIYALDLKLFNENLESLMRGEEVEIPNFNFKTGSREYTGEKLRIPKNGVVVIEGIHGLNEMLTFSIPKENKFKIYISALTQLNLDNHNRIHTTDVRIIRRIVRDFLSRGYGGEETLNMWPSIKRGEEKNIFVFQEQADVMFNSNIVYELCVLKKFALEELGKIKIDSPVFYEAKRLITFLNFFKEVDTKYVPDNSILREFIGGSCFYKY